MCACMCVYTSVCVCVRACVRVNMSAIKQGVSDALVVCEGAAQEREIEGVERRLRVT
jgi:hypothetical protein